MAKKFTKRKRNYGRNFGKGKGKFSTAHRSKLGKPSKGLQSSRYMFAPRISETLLSVNGGPMPNGRWTNNAGLTALMHDGAFALNDLPNHFQYVSLFEAYRINAVKIEFIPQSIIVQSGIGIDKQLMCYNFTDYNNTIGGGAAMPLESELLTMQRCRKRQWISNKPLVVYAKMRQKNVITEAVGALTYAFTRQKPKWIGTDEPAVEHYGLNTIFTSQDGTVLPARPLKMIVTYYIECRGVK